MKKAKRKECDCVTQVNEQLKPKGFLLESAIQMCFETGKGSMAGPFLAVTRVGGSKSRAKLPLMICAYCPFCGRKK